MRPLITMFLTFIISLLFISPSLAIASTDQYLPVDDAFNPTLIQDDNKVTIRFAIAPKYYLYQERFSYEPINTAIAKFELADGISHNDEYMGLSHIYHNSVDLNFFLAKTDPFPQIKVTYQGCTEGMCYPPTSKTFTLDRIVTPYKATEAFPPTAIETIKSNDTSFSTFTSLSLEDGNGIYHHVKNNGLFTGLLIFFLLGVLLSLTPCVFPMYPIWSAIILGNREKNLKTNVIYSFSYIQGMAIAYMIAGVCIASLGAKFHAFIQQPIVLGVISALFIILSLSMFGLFNISLPTKFVNKLENISANQKAGSIAGVFFMGVISAIVASPCTTAPLAGALVFIIQDGDILKGALNLYFLGIGMGTPLVIIGILGQKFLPKNGNWMYRVKAICGFLMLAVPLFILQSYLSTQVLLSLWILLVCALIAYLFFSFNLAFRKGFTVALSICAMGTIYYIFLNTVEFSHKDNFEEVKTVSELTSILDNNKLVLLDFRAKWCKSCIKLEQETFTDKDVQQSLKDFKLVYADTTDTTNPSFEIVEKYQVNGVPVILAFKDGKLVKRFEGFQDATSFSKSIALLN